MDGAEPPLDGLRLAAPPSAAELDAARYGFHRTFPERSAKRVVYFTQFLALCALGAAFVWAFRAAPALTWEVLHIGGLVVFAAAILFRLFAAGSLTPTLWRLANPQRYPVYTVLCPLYREANVIPGLVASLNALDYPACCVDACEETEGLIGEHSTPNTWRRAKPDQLMCKRCHKIKTLRDIKNIWKAKRLNGEALSQYERRRRYGAQLRSRPLQSRRDQPGALPWKR